MQTKQIADQKEGKARAGPGKNARIRSRYSRRDVRVESKPFSLRNLAKKSFIWTFQDMIDRRQSWCRRSATESRPRNQIKIV